MDSPRFCLKTVRSFGFSWWPKGTDFILQGQTQEPLGTSSEIKAKGHNCNSLSFSWVSTVAFSFFILPSVDLVGCGSLSCLVLSPIPGTDGCPALQPPSLKYPWGWNPSGKFSSPLVLFWDTSGWIVKVLLFTGHFQVWWLTTGLSPQICLAELAWPDVCAAPQISEFD